MKDFFIVLVVVLGFCIFGWLVFITIKEDQKFSDECKKRGMIVVKPFKDDPYCTKGWR